MTVETARELINLYLAHIATKVDLDTLSDEHATLPLAKKLGIEQYQTFISKFKEDPESELAFLFVYLTVPDKIIAHRLFNLVNDLSWYFTKQEKHVPPSIIPILIYNGTEDFEPQSLKKIYTNPERAPEFYFEFIDLNKHLYSLIGE